MRPSDGLARVFLASSRPWPVSAGGRLVGLVVLCGWSAWLALDSFERYDAGVITPHANDRPEWVRLIVAGEAPTPYRYRVLVPLATVALGSALPEVRPSDVDRMVALASLLFSYLGLTLLVFATTGNLAWALVAGLLAAVPWNTTFRAHGYQPWSYLEPCFLALSLAALHAGRATAFALATTLAALNRETGVLLAVLALPSLVDDLRARRGWQAWLRSPWIPAMAAPFVAYAVVRLLQGVGPGAVDVAALWHRNTHELDRAGRALWSFYGWLWPVVGWVVVRTLRRPEQRLYVALTLALVAAFGVWAETRMLNTLAALVAILVPTLVPTLVARWRDRSAAAVVSPKS